MNHKIAKQLKDAGFPQTSKPTKVEFYNSKGGFKLSEPRQNISLSELIEACGKEFYQLTQKEIILEPKWIATAIIPIVKEIIAQGKTKKEAVAKLWLKLNK